MVGALDTGTEEELPVADVQLAQAAPQQEFVPEWRKLQTQTPAQAPVQPTAPALNTSPVKPQEPAWSDEDEMRAEEMLNEEYGRKAKVVRSHQGDFRELSKDVPSVDELVAQDPRAARLQAAIELAKQAPTKQDATFAASLIKSLQTQIRADAARTYTAKMKEIQATNNQQVSKAQGEALSGEAWEKKLAEVEGAGEAMTNEVTKLVTATDPQVRLKATVDAATLPTNTLGKAFPLVTSRMAQLSHLDARSAARTMTAMLAVTTDPSQPGFNGYRGRAAANYKKIGTDAVGNPLFELPDGQTVRIAAQDFKLIEKARVQGYNNLKELAKKRALEREEQSKPGIVGRTMNAATKMFQ